MAAPSGPVTRNRTNSLEYIDKCREHELRGAASTLCPLETL